MTERADVSVVIPTYQREQVLLETIEIVLNQNPRAREVLVIDQTPEHEPATEQRLREYHEAGDICWVRLAEPSIPRSMNHGLRQAKSSIVLFLDDDITAASDLIARHATAHQEFPDAWAVVGRVLQPGETAQDVPANCQRTGLRADLEFPFYSTTGDWLANVMAGNLSVNREFALRIGGFDENFTGVAYRFETEFARRMIQNGGRIRYCPEASINHLRAERGGTRSTGSHLTSADPKYGIGDYYFAFLQGGASEAWRYSIYRLFREVRTRFHLSHPWWIPVKIIGELRAMWRGWWMAGRKKAVVSRK